MASAHSLSDNYSRLLLGDAAEGHQGSGAGGGGDLEQQSDAEGQDPLLFAQMGSGLQVGCFGLPEPLSGLQTCRDAFALSRAMP